MPRRRQFPNKSAKMNLTIHRYDTMLLSNHDVWVLNSSLNTQSYQVKHFFFHFHFFGLSNLEIRDDISFITKHSPAQP